MPPDEDIPVQRRTNSDIYLLIEEVRAEAKLNKVQLNNSIKEVRSQIDNHLKFHEGVLLAAKELSDKRLRVLSLTVAVATFFLSAVAIIVGVTIAS